MMSIPGHTEKAPPKVDTRLLVNRRTSRRFEEAGHAVVAEQAVDLASAHRLGAVCDRRGSEIYLLSQLEAAARCTALVYMNDQGVQLGSDTLLVSMERHPVPQLDQTFEHFLRCYDRPDLDLSSLGEATLPADQNRVYQSLAGELFLLDMLVDNPAAAGLKSLFDDAELARLTPYRQLVGQLSELMLKPGSETPWHKRLTDLLREPLEVCPENLAAQVDFVLQHWRDWLPDELINALAVARAIVLEEEQVRMSGPGPSAAPQFGEDEGQAAFTSDTDWMPNAVLIAKSIHVWLDQLSTEYRTPVRTLRDIPDSALELLANRGFNALWLIGLWERSAASRQIKQLCGNPEAEASAYALKAYRPAQELGGEEALDDLHRRCERYGIRLATDVVPNHTGVDSEWVHQHPDWFIQVDQPPYPAYRFEGPDLSDDPATSIRIESGYWDHSDAAVVFEHTDHGSGRKRYIYHGNDGTHMPWNDTAQLDFLRSDVRQAMSDLIVAVARRFRLIRFDAAMTLARKHFRRLWYPPPGDSAGVPSRSSQCMEQDAFDRAFPVEFWRDVVDRINREVPDTLLIAEAFWLMESYFVRNLGMHRVYNSAFMNMLKREENAKYRKILKDILAYNPEILQRYVNFMNNPDEATAVAQFGKGDKYFGVAVMLATLPGLPMFGHGQVEGYEEKYGMEYRRAYWDETPDQGFIEHHERQIFPLLRQRSLFSGADGFALYDLVTQQGVAEDVYAFSNGPVGRKQLVLFNNSPHPVHGRIHQAAPKARPEEEGDARPSAPLAEQFGISADRAPFYRCRDHSDGDDYLFRSTDLASGMEVQLAGYQTRVLQDFCPLDDADGDWQRLYESLGRRPVANLDRALLQQRYGHLWADFQRLLDAGRLKALAGLLTALPLTSVAISVIEELDREINALVEQIRGQEDETRARTPSEKALLIRVEPLAETLHLLAQEGAPGKLLRELWEGRGALESLGVPLLSWTVVSRLGALCEAASPSATFELLAKFGLDHAWRERPTDAHRRLAVQLLQSEEDEPHPSVDDEIFRQLLQDSELREQVGINRHEGVDWLDREGFTALVGCLAMQACCQASEDGLNAPLERLRQRLARAAAVGYRLDKFLQLG